MGAKKVGHARKILARARPEDLRGEPLMVDTGLAGRINLAEEGEEPRLWDGRIEFREPSIKAVSVLVASRGDQAKGQKANFSGIAECAFLAETDDRMFESVKEVEEFALAAPYAYATLVDALAHWFSILGEQSLERRRTWKGTRSSDPNTPSPSDSGSPSPKSEG